jgi:hypothetical protein
MTLLTGAMAAVFLLLTLSMSTVMEDGAAHDRPSSAAPRLPWAQSRGVDPSAPPANSA